MTNFNDYLNDLKESFNSDPEENRFNAITEGIKNLKGKISKLDLQPSRKSELGKWSEGIKRAPQPEDKAAPADRAISLYKNNIKPTPDTPVEDPTAGPKVFTKSQQDSIVAAARALAGGRSSGDAGKWSPSGPNGGSLGKQTEVGQNGGNYGPMAGNPAFSAGVGPGNLTVGEEVESLEDYKARIFESFGLEEAAPVAAALAKGAVKALAPMAKGAVKALAPTAKAVAADVAKSGIQDAGERAKKAIHNRINPDEVKKEEVESLAIALNLLEDASWQSVDKCSREVAAEYGTTLKELNKAFREEFGQYPDKWISEQVIAEECGLMPLCEVARVYETGLLYDVTLIWRGKTMRMQFFWPSAGRPSKQQMQHAVELFYPTGKLVSWYPSRDQDAGAFIMVPPMSESFIALDEDDWVQLSEEDAATYEHICTEVGEPVFAPVALEEHYALLVSDHSTGEEFTVTFGEGLLNVFKDKRSPEEKKHAKLKKMANELDRLHRHVNDGHSDVAKRSKKAGVSEAVYARVFGEEKAVVSEQSGCSSRDGKPSGDDTRKVTLKPQALRQARARRDSFLKTLKNSEGKSVKG